MATDSPPASGAELMGMIRRLGLQADGWLSDSPQTPPETARRLVIAKVLTPYQAEQLLNGNGAALNLGQYLILEPLGRGGMGEVFKARHRLMKRVVALKVIHPERVAHPVAVQRFRREIQALARLSHPNLIVAHDAEEIEGRFFLVMEFCEGETLRQRVRGGGPLPFATACALIRQTALGLEHAHAQGITHRDVKPDNLLLTAQGVKVLDLGLAMFHSELSVDTAVSSITEQGQLLGTPDYVAPEQVLDARNVDARSDIYSLGCTLYFALTGQPPFPGGTVLEKALRHRSEEPMPLERLCQVPQALAELVRSMMRKDPELRIQSATVVARRLCDWAQCDDSAEVAALSAPASTVETPLTAASAPRMPRGKRRWPWLAAATGVLCVILGIAWLVAGRGGRGASIQEPAKPGTPSKIAEGTVRPVEPMPGDSPATSAWDVVATRAFPQTHWAATFAPDGKTVAVAHGEFLGGEGKRVLTFWNIQTRETVEIGGHDAPIRRVEFSPKGDLVVTACGTFNFDSTGEVKVWRNQMKPQISLARFLAHELGCGGVAFSLDGKKLATCGMDKLESSLKIWDVASGELLSVVYKSPKVLNAVAISPDGTLLACAGAEKVIHLWDMKTESKVLQSGMVSGTPLSLAFSPDGKVLAASLYSEKEMWGMGAVAHWRFAEKKEIEEIRIAGTSGGPHLLDVAFHPSGTFLAAARDDGEIWLCDLLRKESHPLLGKKHTHAVNSVNFSQDGKLVSTCSATVKVWQLKADHDK